MFGLSKLADRDFVIGFVLPVLIAGAGMAFLFRHTEAAGFIYTALLDEKSFTGLTMLVLAVWTLATLLMAWNTAIYRLLEGYAGPFKCEHWRTAMKQHFRAEQAAIESLGRRIQDLEGCPEADQPRRERYEAEYFKRLFEWPKAMPFREDLVLPTRFGNAIRAFETYSLKVYGADAIPFWGRLTGVVPDSYAAQINEARAEVNFFVNIWALSIVFAGSGAIRLMIELYGESARPDWQASPLGFETPIAILLGLAIAYAAYGSAIKGAIAWGELVKSAFDLYLPKLAEQMGYTLPIAADGQRDFWDAATEMFLLQNPIPPDRRPVPPDPARE